MDTLVYPGAKAIKNLGNGKVGGYLCEFGDAQSRDVDGEYFDKTTDFDIQDGDRRSGYYDHGLDPAIKNDKIGVGTMKIDETGVWLEAQIDLRHKYANRILQLVDQGHLGLSSGAVTHLVRYKQEGKVKKITSWPIGEWSLTVRPCDARTKAMSIKSYSDLEAAVKIAETIDAEEDEETEHDVDAGKGQETKKSFSASIIAPGQYPSVTAKLNQHIEDRVDDGLTRDDITIKMAREAGIERRMVNEILAGKVAPSNAQLKAFARVLEVDYAGLKEKVRTDQSRTVKSIFEMAIEDNDSRLAIESAYNGIVTNLAEIAKNSDSAGVKFDLETRIDEVTTEYATALRNHAIDQIHEHIKSGANEIFHLKSVVDGTETVKSLNKTDLDTNSDVAEAVSRGVCGRLRVSHEARVNEGKGRVLSDKNRQRAMKLRDHFKSLVSELEGLLEASEPKADAAEMQAERSKFLKSRVKARRLGD